MSPCTHEEADSRMILHAADGAKQGYKNILAISFANRIECEKLNVAFGIGKSFRYLDVPRIALALCNRKSYVLPVCHALTGCNTTSSFAGRGK